MSWPIWQTPEPRRRPTFTLPSGFALWLTPEEYAKESKWPIKVIYDWANPGLTARRCSMRFDERDLDRGGPRMFRIWYQQPNIAGQKRPRRVLRETPTPATSRTPSPAYETQGHDPATSEAHLEEGPGGLSWSHTV